VSHLEGGDEAELPDVPHDPVLVPLAEVHLGVAPRLMPGDEELTLHATRSVIMQVHFNVKFSSRLMKRCGLIKNMRFIKSRSLNISFL
jgi:hypothetical protein